jgi:hypothetical protein
MKERQVFKTFGSLKIDVERVLIESLSFVILIWISDQRKCPLSKPTTNIDVR